MTFFTNISISEIMGLIILIAGAVLNFLSKKIVAKFNIEHSKGDLIIKIIGLVLVVLGFLLILNILYF